MFILQGSGPLGSDPTGPGSGYSVMPCCGADWINKTIKEKRIRQGSKFRCTVKFTKMIMI